MNEYLALDALDNATIERLLARARDLEKNPISAALAGRVVGLLFFNPSLRTLASFQAGVSQLGGSSFVIQPGQGTWDLETELGVTMDGGRAEHIREAVPVLEQYCDALGVRAFASGKDLAVDLAEPVMSAIDAIRSKPLINMESAIDHPCQALADWKTLDDLEVPRNGGRFVLSWAWHPRALPIAVPSAVATMAARRGMDVVIARPEGYALPDAVMDRARAAASASGGSIEETDDPAAAMEGAHVLYAKSWGSTADYGDAEEDAARRAPLRDWCVDESWFGPARSEAKFLHCLPVRRNVVVRDEILDGPRSHVVPQAGNRLHVQKSVLVELLGKDD